MDNLIEVEVENRSYIKLLGLEEQNSKTLRLTTIEDNQTAVIIRIFLNKSGNRLPLKEFAIHHLKPKESGIPRFELNGLYSNKHLYLNLRVDGEKSDYAELNLGPYIRNKFLPLVVIACIIAAILIILAGKWFVSNLLPERNNTGAQTVINNPVLPNRNAGSSPKTTNPPKEKKGTGPLVKTDAPHKHPVEKTESLNPIVKEEIPPGPSIVRKVKISEHTVYFSPNNTDILKDTAKILKALAIELKNNTGAKVEISGHCAMTGTEVGREKLSKERAINVEAYLKEEGWTPETDPVIRWYGATQPVTQKKDEFYRNRRVEIKIVSQ